MHAALGSLPEADRLRLGVVVEHNGVAHELTYRQAEYLNHLIEKALGKQVPDGLPTTHLQDLVDALIDASVLEHYRDVSSSPTSRPWCARRTDRRSPSSCGR